MYKDLGGSDYIGAMIRLRTTDNYERNRTYINQFFLEDRDADDDGIFDVVDTDEMVVSDGFSDGTTTGIIIERGDQNLVITDATNPAEGVVIAAYGGTEKARVSFCGNSKSSLKSGRVMTATCGSVKVNVINGTVEIEFMADDGRIATVNLTEGNGLLFDPTTFVIAAPENNSESVVIVMDGAEITIEPGGSSNEKRVEIDIKPGSYPNSINLKSKGVVSVAVLTTDNFNAGDVDPNTVDFANASPVRWTIEDVDGDNDLDTLYKFKTQDLILDENSTEANLKGETFEGTSIEGSDTVKIVPGGKAKDKK